MFATFFQVGGLSHIDPDLYKASLLSLYMYNLYSQVTFGACMLI